MKNPPRYSRTIFWILLGALTSLTAIALTIQPVLSTQGNSATAGVMIKTATPPARSASEVGSTDGIVLIATIIVLIIIIPILFRWKDWTRSTK